MRALVVVVIVAAAVVVGACGGGNSSSSGSKSTGSSSNAGALGNSSGDARDKGCLAPDQTGDYKGQLVLVCGTVAGSVYMPDQKRTTFVYFGADAPDQTFTAVITGDSRSGFNPFPEDQFTSGVNVCIEGIVQTDDAGKPLIDVQSALNMIVISAPEIHGSHCAGN
jgi:hypothetical protein